MKIIDISTNNKINFLSKKEFEEIKKRIASVPNIDYKLYNSEGINKIVADYDINFSLCIPLYINSENFFLNIRKDCENMISHIENAEIINDQLLSENRALRNKNKELEELLEKNRSKE